MAGLLRRRPRRGRAAARPLPDAAPAAARARAARRRSVADQHRLRQHHPHRPGAVVPRRRGGRAVLPSLDPLERRDDRAPRAAAGRSASAATSRPTRRRPPSTRSASTTSSAARTTTAAATRSTSRATPPPASTPAPTSRAGCPRTGSTASARSSRTAVRARPAVLPAPAADAGLLGVPHGLDGPRPDERDHAGAVQPLPRRPRYQGHVRPARLGVPRRRRDGRAGVPRADPRRGRPRAWTTSPSSSTATCSGSTARSAATARSSRSWSRSSAARAGTSSR